MKPTNDAMSVSLSTSHSRTVTGVSVILPILNEEAHLEQSVSAILSQDYHGKLEIILALGPSRDRTSEIAHQLRKKDSRIILVENPTGRTATGLNLAISQSSFDIIVRVDGHAQIPSNYISMAVSILNETGAVNVGGLMAAEGETNFEKSVAKVMKSPLGVGSSNFHTGGTAGSVDTVYLGCFRRAELLAAGGYDERFTRAQDWELNFRLRSRGGVVYFDPRLYVLYRPRPNLGALSKQYFEYGRWRRAVVRRHQGTVNMRYLAPPFAFIGTLISLFSGFLIAPIFFIPAVIYLSFVVFASLKLGKGLRESFRMPAILLVMQMSWGCGYLTSPKKLAT